MWQPQDYSQYQASMGYSQMPPLMMAPGMAMMQPPFVQMQAFMAQNMMMGGAPRALVMPNGMPVPSGMMVQPPTMLMPTSTDEPMLTNVYVGHIPLIDVENSFVERLLRTCGRIKVFRRTTDPVTGSEKSFGFCEYETPEGALNAVRVLNNFPLFAEHLLVKCDAKTQAFLDRWAAARRAAQGGDADANERRELDRIELFARQVLDEQLNKREKIVARMPRAGHADGRRATPEPDEMELASHNGMPPSITSMSDADVSSKLAQLRATQERRGQRIAGGAASSTAAASSSSSSMNASATSGGGSSVPAGAPAIMTRDSRDARADNMSGNSNARAASAAQEADALKTEVELQAARDARERERIRELREREARRRAEHDAMIADERAREHAERNMARRDDERVERLRRDAARLASEADDLKALQRACASEHERRQLRRSTRRQDFRRREREADLAAEARDRAEAQRRADAEAKAAKERAEAEEAARRERARFELPANASSAIPLKLQGALKRKALAKVALQTPVATLFDANAQTDEEVLYQRKKRALVKLDDDSTTTTTAAASGATGAATTTTSTSTTTTTQLSGKALTGEIDWATIEQHALVEKSLASWIATRVRDMLGDDDAMFVSFVCEQLAQRVAPAALSDALAPVLDSAATAFVDALWQQLRIIGASKK